MWKSSGYISYVNFHFKANGMENDDVEIILW
jgi:hypothetical protein